jgi:serine protease Do
MQPLTSSLAKAMGRTAADGVLVNRVEEDSPAAAAKLQQGDVILAFDGKAIKTPRDLAVAVADTRAGATSKVTVWREGREKAINVTIAKPAKEKVAADAGDEQATGRNPVGLALAPLSAEQREELSVPKATKGVVVTQVTPGSRADDSGFKAGDVIVRVGDEPVTTPSEAVAKIRQAEDAKKEALPLLVMREGTTYYLALQLTAS